MLTIYLIGEKSTMSFDLEAAPTAAFIRHNGKLYHRSDEKKLVWEHAEGELPTGASVSDIDHPELSTPLAPAPPAAPAEPAKPTDPTADAQSDQPKAV